MTSPEPKYLHLSAPLASPSSMIGSIEQQQPLHRRLPMRNKFIARSPDQDTNFIKNTSNISNNMENVKEGKSEVEGSNAHGLSYRYRRSFALSNDDTSILPHLHGGLELLPGEEPSKYVEKKEAVEKETPGEKKVFDSLGVRPHRPTLKCDATTHSRESLYLMHDGLS
uniref:Sulfhydryl oxidase 1 n=1 Tax=Lygus hesperus TaxID=30085 RepID=A0A0A9XGD1_LYGHE